MTKYIIVLPFFCFHLAQESFCTCERRNKTISTECCQLDMVDRNFISHISVESSKSHVTGYKATQPVLLLTVFYLV